MYSNMVNSRKRSPNDCDKEQSDNYPCQEKPLKLVKREILQQKEQDDDEDDDEVHIQDQRNDEIYRMDEEQDDDFDDEDDDVYDTNEVKIYVHLDASY